MTVLFVFYILSTVVYGFFIVSLVFGLNRLKTQKSGLQHTFVSVIIPARNEEKNISKCLKALIGQSYPKELFEILIVDDFSTDLTGQIVREFAAQHNNIRLISLTETNTGVSPKKRAIEAGIQQSRGEIIFTTDADSLAPPGWLETVLRYFDEDTGLVASWLQVNPGKKLLGKLESLDSLSMVITGAAAFGLGFPVLANGANLAYRKSLFQDMNGFQGSEQLASGDDDLLLQKIFKQSKWKAVFAPDLSASVSTEANFSLQDFFSQRVRWASKSGTYPLSVLAFEIFLYCYFLFIFLSIPLLFVSFVYLIFPAVKLLLDYVVMKRGCDKLNRNLSPVYFLPAIFFQMGYILIAGIAGLTGKFTWKNRLYLKGKPVSSKN
ncbi:glycosyltransferase [candidate division KSB1 bacterium]|nr:glycosyltransferase [candidate division KSB1 bacterium]